AVEHETAFLARHGLETAPAIATQPETAATVIARRLGLHVEKILAQKQVFLTIPIEVTHADAESRRHLRFHRQRLRREAAAPIEEHHRAQIADLQSAGGLRSISQGLLDAGAAKRVMRRKLLPEKWDRFRQKI